MTLVFVAVVAGGLSIAWLTGDRTGSTVAAEGHRAPQFAVTLFDGARFDLSEHVSDDGRPLVLNLWASWCAPCRAEIPGLSAWAMENPGVAVLGVAVEDNEVDARALAEELVPSYGLAMGDEAFRAAYPSLGLPATYVINESGRVVDVVFGVVTADVLDEALGITDG